MMTHMQKGRRMILAVAAAVLAAAPLRSARAKRQVREDQGRAGGRGQVGFPGSGGGASSFIWARNETGFAQALQDGAAERFVPMFHSPTAVTLTQTIHHLPPDRS